MSTLHVLIPQSALESLYGFAVPTKTNPGVIPSLMDVLSEAAERANLDHVDLRPLTNGLGRGGKRLSEKQIQRYLEGKAPPGEGVESWVQLISLATQTKDRFAFWREAVERAENDDPPARATGSAKKASEKSPRKSPSKP